MQDARLDHWAGMLAQAGAERRPIAVPAELLACPREDALQVQARHARRTLQRLGGSIAGCKLGGTTEAAQQALGLAAPFTGPIFSARSHQSPAVLQRGEFMACIVEAEIGVRLGADLASPQQCTRTELLAAIDDMFPAIELADSRYTGWAKASASAILADLGYAGAWVRGSSFAGWRDLDLVQLPVGLSLDGRRVSQGSGANVLGDPLHSLGLAAAELARQGQPLRAGDFVSLGSCTSPFPSAGGGRFVADFGPLGQVAVTLQA